MIDQSSSWVKRGGEVSTRARRMRGIDRRMTSGKKSFDAPVLQSVSVQIVTFLFGFFICFL